MMKAEITYREATLSGVRFLLCLNTGLLLSWRCTDIDMLAVAGLWGYTCKWPSHERGRERSGLLVVGTRKRWMQGKRGAVCCRHSQRQRGAHGARRRRSPRKRGNRERNCLLLQRTIEREADFLVVFEITVLRQHTQLFLPQTVPKSTLSKG